jgi:hypothetical protein
LETGWGTVQNLFGSSGGIGSTSGGGHQLDPTIGWVGTPLDEA